MGGTEGEAEGQDRIFLALCDDKRKGMELFLSSHVGDEGSVPAAPTEVEF